MKKDHSVWRFRENKRNSNSFSFMVIKGGTGESDHSRGSGGNLQFLGIEF